MLYLLLGISQTCRMLVGKSSGSLRGWPLTLVSQLFAGLLVFSAVAVSPPGCQARSSSSCCRGVTACRPRRGEGCRVSAARLELICCSTNHCSWVLQAAVSPSLLPSSLPENSSAASSWQYVKMPANFYFVQTDKIQVALNHVSVRSRSPAWAWSRLGLDSEPVGSAAARE